MEDRITFIIPSLNRPTISRSIDSLINQTNPNWDCVVIYDGGDGIDFYDERVQTIKIEKTGTIGPFNGQSGLVRNVGISMCKTKWIGFLDDDDTLNPNYVDDLFKKYNDYDFVVWRMRYSDGRVLPPFGSNDLSFGNVGISFCYKNKFEGLLFDSNRNGEDFDMVTKLKSLTNNFIITPEVYYNIRY